MKFLVLMSSFICLTTVNAGVVPNGNTATNIQGPSSQSKIMGPDGSVIMAEAPGGLIIHEETPGVFAPAGHFLDPASPLINPAVPGIAARTAIDSVMSGPAHAIVAGKSTAQTARDGTHSAMGVLDTPNGYMAGIDVERQEI